MHEMDIIDEVDATKGVLKTRRGFCFLLTTPVPDFISGWKVGDQIWVSEAGGDFELRTSDRMEEIASAIRRGSKSDS